MVFAVSEDFLLRILGGFLLTYMIFLYLKPRFKLAKTDTNAVVGGALSGFFAGILGVSPFPRVEALETPPKIAPR